MKPLSIYAAALFALAAAVCFPRLAAAQAVTWGGSNGNYNTGADWLGGQVPGTSKDALIDSGTVNLPASVTGTAAAINVGMSGTGTLTIDGGYLSTTGDLNIAAFAGSVGVVNVSSGTLASLEINIGQNGTGTLNLTGSGVVSTGTGGVVYIGEVSGSGTLNIGTGGAAGTLITPEITLGDEGGAGTLNFNHTGTYICSSIITGVKINQMGPGVTILTGNAQYSGSMSISSGTLQIGNSGTSGSVAKPGVSANINISGGAALVFDESGSLGVGANITGAGTVEQIGTGCSIITGDNTYGDTVITSGTLQVGNGNYTTSLGTGTVANNGVLIIDQGFASAGFGDITVANNISGTGSLVQSGVYAYSTTLLTGSNSYTGGNVITSGDLQLGGNYALGSGTNPLSMTGGALDMNGFNASVGSLSGSSGTKITSSVPGAVTLTVNEGGSTTYSGTIQNGSGTVSLTVNGPGDLTLGANNTYTGTTGINSGTLTVNGKIASSPAVIAGGVLNGSGTTGTVTVDSGGVLTGGGAAGNVTVNSGGLVSGSRSMGAISGSGTVAPGGNSILTASQADPTSGMSYNFHFSGTGSPNYGNAAASGNDVLHITGATPLVSALTSANTIAVDFTGLVLQSGQIYYGGLFTDAAIANSMVQNATFSYTGLGGAVVQFEGMTTVASAPFATGTVSNGEVMQFDVTGSPVPAAPPWALLLAGTGLLIAACRRVKA